MKGQYFEKQDLVHMVRLLKELICNLISDTSVKQASTLDEFVLFSSSKLLRLLRDHFAVGDYLDTRLWDITGFDWRGVVEHESFTNEIKRIIQYMPEGIPFDVRALLFMQYVEHDKIKNKGQVKYKAIVKRENMFEDSFR